MAEECSEAVCPACDNSFEKEPNNCGFTDCTYSIIGTMTDGTKFKEENKLAPKDGFLTFEEVVDGKSKIAQWKFLKVITQPTS